MWLMTFSEYVKVAAAGFAPPEQSAPAAPKIETGVRAPTPSGLSATPGVNLPTGAKAPKPPSAVPTLPKPKGPPKPPKVPKPMKALAKLGFFQEYVQSTGIANFPT